MNTNFVECSDSYEMLSGTIWSYRLPTQSISADCVHLRFFTNQMISSSAYNFEQMSRLVGVAVHCLGGDYPTCPVGIIEHECRLLPVIDSARRQMRFRCSPKIQRLSSYDRRLTNMIKLNTQNYKYQQGNNPKQQYTTPDNAQRAKLPAGQECAKSRANNRQIEEYYYV